MNIVYPKGPVSSPVLLVGEAPGREEVLRGEPFVGRSGEEQEWYLSRHNLSAKTWRKANVVWEFTEGDHELTRAQIDYWTPKLEEEIANVRPRVVVAVGRFAMRWFLGEGATLDACHGLPHHAGAFDSSRANRAGGAVVIPIHHPAFGFYSGDARALIDWDYSQVARVLKLIKAGKPVDIVRDECDGNEQYLDVSGRDFATTLSLSSSPMIAIDTEGTPDDPWSIQASTRAGHALVLRRSQPDFAQGIEYLQEAADSGSTIILHNAMWDMEVCRAMGLELRRARIFDTMYAAYLLRVEPQGLKPLARRWCGMEMSKFDSVVAQAASGRQLDYLAEVVTLGEPPKRPEAPQKPRKPKLTLSAIPKADRPAAKATAAAEWWEAKNQYEIARHCWEEECARPIYSYGRWGRPDEQIETNNAGESRVYRPQGLYLRALSMLSAYTAYQWTPEDERDEDDEPIPLYVMWQTIPPEVRAPAEAELGPFPATTLDDVPLEVVTHYAARDADATFRLCHRLVPELDRLDLRRTMVDCMEVLPVFEEIQYNGMVASRSRFEALNADVERQMAILQSKISREFFDGRPFNPASSPHVATLMRRRGLEGEKKTSSGKMSTGKKSIEHLRHSDPAIALVIDWREHQKVRDSFCKPALERAALVNRLDEEGDLFPFRCRIKTTRVATRRLAASDPNLLQIPTRTEIGKRVRDCYVAPPGQLYGSWDLSQIELRFVAHESRDPLMCRLIREGADLHTETALRLFNVTPETMDKKLHRLPAKTINFGVLYGVTGPGLFTQFQMLRVPGDWSPDRCQQLINDWFDLYSGIKEYCAQSARDARKTGYVRDHWGMYRYIPGIWSYDSKVSAEAARIAVSHKIQGGAQGLIQRSMIWLKHKIWELQDEGLNVHWCLQIHDELILRFDAVLESLINDLVLEALTEHGGLVLRVPVEAGGGCAQSWGGLKE